MHTVGSGEKTEKIKQTKRSCSFGNFFLFGEVLRNCRTIMIEDSFYYMVIYVSTMTDDLNIDIRNNT